MLKNYKRERGVTLVALAVTIVVLLILAGLTLSLVLGQNGIISKASESSRTMTKAQAEENVAMILQNYNMEKTTDGITLENFLKDQNNKGIIDNIINNGDETYTVEANGFNVTFKKDTLEITESEKVDGIRPILETYVYQKDGSALVQDAKYNEVAITVNVINKTKLDSIDSIEMTNEYGETIDANDSVIGTGDRSYIVNESGKYRIKVIATTNGVTKEKNAQVIITQIPFRAGLKVGDFVNYDGDGPSNYTNFNEGNSGSAHSKDPIPKDNLDWQILNIHNDGSIDLMGSITSSKLYFCGSLGYNNGVYLMNDICEKLYSNSIMNIKARSVNLNDFDNWLTDNGKNARSEYLSGGNIKFGADKKFMDGMNFYPKLYAQENNSAIDTEDFKTNGINMTDSTSPLVPIPTSETYAQASNFIKVKQTYWYSGDNNLNTDYFGEGANVLHSSDYYWVASRYASNNDDGVSFGLRDAGPDLGGYYMFASDTDVAEINYHLRPVVTIGTNFRIRPSNGENSKTNTDTIIEKK